MWSDSRLTLCTVGSPPAGHTFTAPVRRAARAIVETRTRMAAVLAPEAGLTLAVTQHTCGIILYYTYVLYRPRVTLYLYDDIYTVHTLLYTHGTKTVDTLYIYIHCCTYMVHKL